MASLSLEGVSNWTGRSPQHDEKVSLAFYERYALPSSWVLCEHICIEATKWTLRLLLEIKPCFLKKYFMKEFLFQIFCSKFDEKTWCGSLRLTCHGRNGVTDKKGWRCLFLSQCSPWSHMNYANLSAFWHSLVAALRAVLYFLLSLRKNVLVWLWAITPLH